MEYATHLVAIWLVLQCSAMMLPDKLNMEELSKRLHDPSKERIDLDCDACVAVVDLIQFLVRQNASEAEMVHGVTRFCIDLKIEDNLVCTQVVQEFKNEAIYVFTTVALGPEEICGFLIGAGCGQVYNPWKQNWTVTLTDVPKPPINQSVPKPDVPLVKILHLSDIHIDLEYTEGLNAECGEPLCCRPPNNPAPPGRPAGHWGDYNCDMPWTTANSLFEHLALHKDEFDWIYWTGDLPAHNVWNQTRSEQLELLQLLSTQLKAYLGDKMIYPTLGNHESAPVNSFPPPFITGENSNQWLLDAYQVDFSHWLPSSTSSTIKKGGFYAVKVAPGLKLISLNMNYCSSGNALCGALKLEEYYIITEGAAHGHYRWLLINSTDPAGQLQWMVGELQASEDAGEKVHVIGHIAPGLSPCNPVWSWNYHRIVNRYESTVVGQFFGHRHEDEFEVFYDEKDPSRAILVAFVGPSVTPYQHNNPAYRIYEMDGLHEDTTFQLINHHVYFLNLTTANSENKPAWEYLYGAKESYGLKSLQPQEWSDLVDRMETNDTLFDRFLKHHHRRGTVDCNLEDCGRKSILCTLKTAQSHDTSHCHNITQAYRYYYNHKSC